MFKFLTLVSLRIRYLIKEKPSKNLKQKCFSYYSHLVKLSNILAVINANNLFYNPAYDFHNSFSDDQMITETEYFQCWAYVWFPGKKSTSEKFLPRKLPSGD